MPNKKRKGKGKGKGRQSNAPIPSSGEPSAAPVESVELQSVDLQSVDLQSVDIQSVDLHSVGLRSVELQAIEEGLSYAPRVAKAESQQLQANGNNIMSLAAALAGSNVTAIHSDQAQGVYRVCLQASMSLSVLSFGIGLLLNQMPNCDQGTAVDAAKLR